MLVFPWIYLVLWFLELSKKSKPKVSYFQNVQKQTKIKSFWQNQKITQYWSRPMLGGYQKKLENRTKFESNSHLEFC